MPDSIDWPRTPPQHRRRFLLMLAVIVGILFAGRTAFSYYVDVLWFGSLGYAEVFWKSLSLQSGVFAAFAVATFLVLYGSFLASQARVSSRFAQRPNYFRWRAADQAPG